MGNLMHKWSVPDFTWSAVATNYISFILPENYKTDLVVDSLLMVRRLIQKDVPFSMFHDKRVLLEGVDKDFWWLNSNGQMRPPISTIRMVSNQNVVVSLAKALRYHPDTIQIFGTSCPNSTVYVRKYVCTPLLKKFCLFQLL
jgi:hypothetical protein